MLYNFCDIIFKTWNSLEYGKSRKMIHNFLFDKRIRNTSLIYCLRLFESKLLIYGPEKFKNFLEKVLEVKQCELWQSIIFYGV